MKKEISNELVKKFLANKCTREEAEAVHHYLTKHPEVLDANLHEQEWELFPVEPAIAEDRSNAWLQYIQANKQEKKSLVLRMPRLRIAVAVLLLLAGAGSLYYLLQPAAHPALPLAMQTTHAPVRKEKWLVNNSSEPVNDTLDDGSVIRLYKNSIITLAQPFDKDKRDLHLQGEAVFYVAKDKKRPFTVFTEGFSTTALGTIFRINAYASGTPGVKLLQGKVVVRNLRQGAAPVYLLPGDECSFNNTDSRLYFHGMQTAKRAPVSAKPSGDVYETEDEISFSNRSLQDVFARINQLYHTNIQFDSTKAKGRTFTGSFLKQQPVEDVLATIAQLNNLTVSKNETGYRLTAD